MSLHGYRICTSLSSLCRQGGREPGGPTGVLLRSAAPATSMSSHGYRMSTSAVVAVSAEGAGARRAHG
eukprot:6228992-Amphidinium_carterae.1